MLLTALLLFAGLLISLTLTVIHFGRRKESPTALKAWYFYDSAASAFTLGLAFIPPANTFVSGFLAAVALLSAISSISEYFRVKAERNWK